MNTEGIKTQSDEWVQCAIYWMIDRMLRVQNKAKIIQTLVHHVKDPVSKKILFQSFDAEMVICLIDYYINRK